MGSEVIVAIPEMTELAWLAFAIGPVVNGRIRIAAIEVPSTPPSKTMASKVLNSVLSCAKRRMKTRATRTNAAHIALVQTGLASPTEVTTIAVVSQVATANELRRKST